MAPGANKRPIHLNVHAITGGELFITGKGNNRVKDIALITANISFFRRIRD